MGGRLGLRRRLGCKKAVTHHLRHAILALLFVCFVLPALAQHSPQATYRTAASILALPPERISQSEPVLLRGVITRSTDYGFVLQDATAGIWIFLDHPRDYSAHDEIELTGTVYHGRFSPGVKPLSIRKIGRGALPAPRVIDMHDLDTGNLDCQFVSVTGTVRSVGLRPMASQSQRLWLKIATSTSSIYASLPEEDLSAARGLVDALVKVDAAASCTKNQNGQIIAPTLMVPGMESITVLQPARPDLFSISRIPIKRLMQYRSGTDYSHRVTVAGTVTYYKPGECLIVEDEGHALYIASIQQGSLQLGDRVEVAGYPAPTSTGPILQDAIFRYTGRGEPVQPRSVDAGQLATGTFNHSLVSVEGRFLRRVQEPYRIVLLLQTGSTLLLAQLAEPEQSNELEQLREGSIVRVAGISMLDAEGTWNVDGPTASAIRYEILLRSREDLHVIAPSSWWTTRHVTYLAAALAVLLLIFAARDIYNRIAQWKLRAVLEERERMAFEMHDTLAQSLAGIGFQLQAIRKGIPAGTPRLLEQVDVARSLVQHSHKEAHRNVDPSVLALSAETDLLSALRQCASSMVAGSEVRVETSLAGKQCPMPAKVMNELLRIGQEAIANAVRHANPTCLRLGIVFEENTIRLSVYDDGCGFTKSGDLLGFGLRGMRKRAASLSGTLTIESKPGEGTRVEIVAPLPPTPGLALRIQQGWKYFTERVLHVS